MKNIYFVSLISLFFLQMGTAQIVDIEKKRKHESDTLGVFGYVDIGFNFVENGSNIFTARNNAQLEFVKNANRFLSISNFNFVRANEDNFVNDGFQHFRYNRTFSPKLIYEAFSQIQYNQKTRVELRALAGTGLRMPILTGERRNAYLGLSYMFERNEIRDTNIIHHDHRLSSYLSFQIKPTETLTLSGTTYFQPILPDFAFPRISSTISLHLKITSKLSFRCNFQLTHDSRVKEDSPGVPETIYSVANSLRFDF